VLLVGQLWSRAMGSGRNRIRLSIYSTIYHCGSAVDQSQGGHGEMTVSDKELESGQKWKQLRCKHFWRPAVRPYSGLGIGYHQLVGVYNYCHKVKGMTQEEFYAYFNRIYP
jgi:hypothetical protein